MTLTADRHEMLARVLDDHGASELWLGTPAGFAWLTGGDNIVSLGGSTGVAAAGYDGDGVTVVADHIEADRLRREELDEAVTVESFDWYEGSVAAAVAERAAPDAVADFDVPGLEEVALPMRAAPLTDAEQSRYADVCADATTAVEHVARAVTAETTEREAAASLAAELRTRGLYPLVVLVAGQRRAQEHKHFLPKDEPLEGYGILTVVGMRAGLHACLTRTVAFDPPSWLVERHRDACRIEATALRATQRAAASGGTAGDVFAAIQAAYDDLGHGDHWHAHHQGGATGYAGREWFGTPDSDQAVHAPKAYAWNPTVHGSKSEDTVLVTDDDVEWLSASGDWPTVTAEPLGDGDAIERPAILEK